MAISALDRMGMPLVERLDNSVAEAELKLANNNLIGDGGAVRQIRAGSLMGSDIFIVGGITELNYNIGSVAQDAFIDGVGVSGNAYVMNIALDLRVVDTDSMRVLDVVSYQKQILGREIRAGVFQFFDDTVFDLSVSERALEPMQLAVRAMIERAAGEMARSLFSLTSEVCAPSTEPEAAASATHEGDQT
jgi:curli production assembly/transport component CsgG/holdfast attachment protein HfaB